MATKEIAKETPQAEPVPVFEKSEIIKSAGLFGVRPEIMAGALSLCTKDKLTKKEAEAAVKAFLAKPVGKE